MHLFSQIQDEARAEAFWKDNVQAIIDGDMAKVLSQTNYPLDVRKSVGFETLLDEDWSQAKLKANYESTFTGPVTSKFTGRDLTYIDAWEYSDGMTYMVTYSNMKDESGIVFSFKQFGED